MTSLITNHWNEYPSRPWTLKSQSGKNPDHARIRTWVIRCKDEHATYLTKVNGKELKRHRERRALKERSERKINYYKLLTKVGCITDYLSQFRRGCGNYSYRSMKPVLSTAWQRSRCLLRDAILRPQIYCVAFDQVPCSSKMWNCKLLVQYFRIRLQYFKFWAF